MPVMGPLIRPLGCWPRSGDEGGCASGWVQAAELSSITHATGATASWIRAASRRRTAVKSHVEDVMNCCNR